MDYPIGRVLKLVALVGLLMVCVTVVFGSWYTVDQRERGVLLRNGKLIATVNPGLNFKWPWIEDVKKISLEQHSVKYDKMNSYSRDQQPADINVTVNFQAMETYVDELYTEFGGMQGFIDRRITPKVYEELKTVFGTYNAATAIQQRGKLNSDVRQAITRAVAGAGDKSYVIITDVQITNIDFSDAYEKSIEQRMLAEVEVQKVLQNAEREKATALITVTKAKADADATVARATADAEAVKLRGNAEAEAIKARAAALASNQNLVGLVIAEKWDGKLPTTIPPNGTVPLLNLQSMGTAQSNVVRPLGN